MGQHISLASHFRQVSGRSPKPPAYALLFSHPATHDGGSTSVLAQEVQRLAAELQQQSQLVGSLASVVAGNPAALAKSATSLLGGSVFGQVADSLAHGFSWQSLVKDVLPLGGLVSEIAGLFTSTPALAPLQRYDAPISLGFSGVLGSSGNISQASENRTGQARSSSSSGLDLLDASGGPRPAYARRTDGALGSIAGAPTSRYSGTLDVSSSQNLTSLEGTPSMPTFDNTWFLDHAPYIAAAVRSAMLDSHPILDVINDL